MQTQHVKRKVPTRLFMNKAYWFIFMVTMLGALLAFALVLNMSIHTQKSAYENIKITSVEPTPTKTVTPTPTVQPATMQGQAPQWQTNSSHMLNLVNAQRAANGLPPLVEITVLDQSAYLKAVDLQSSAFSHYDSRGRWFTGFFHDAGFYNRAAENLAKYYPTDEETIAAWMASPEHRANILEWRAVYFGYAQVGNFRVAHFGAVN